MIDPIFIIHTLMIDYRYAMMIGPICHIIIVDAITMNAICILTIIIMIDAIYTILCNSSSIAVLTIMMCYKSAPLM